MAWDGRRRRIKEIKTARVGTLIFMHDGRLHGYYGPRALADSFENEPAPVLDLIARLCSKGMAPLKAMFTAANPAFWPVAFARDVQSFNRRMPGMARQWQNWMPGGMFLWYAAPAMRAAWSTIKGRPNVVGADALRRGMLISRGAGYMGQFEDDELERMIRRRGLPYVMGEVRGKLDKLRDIWSAWMEYGQFFERTVKIAGMMYMDEKQPRAPDGIKAITVRKWAGSPDFMEKGALNWFIDLGWIFFNPGKEGARSEWQTYTGYNGEPGRKGEMFWQTLRWIIIPALVLEVFRRTKSEWAEMYQEGPSEAERMANRCIPLGWHDKANREAYYLRLPMDPSQRPLSAVVDAAIASAMQEGQPADWGAAFTTAGRELPGANPIWGLAADWKTYWFGGNPYDDFRGRAVLTDDEQKARPETAIPGLKAMGRHTWNSTVGSLAGRIPDPAQSGDSPLTVPKGILRLPVVGQMLGRWIKISNAGYRERMAKPLQTPEAKQAVARMDIRDAVVEQTRTGQLPMDVLTKIAQGKYLYDAYGDAKLTPDMELARYYWTHYQNAAENAVMGTAPIEMRLLRRQPTRALRQSMAAEIIADQNRLKK